MTTITHITESTVEDAALAYLESLGWGVDEDATIWTAWQQLQTYKAELPTLFAMNAALMVSGRGWWSL